MPLDTETCFSKSETFVLQGEHVVCYYGNVSARTGFAKTKQDEGQSHLHSKIQLDDTSLMEKGESKGSLPWYDTVQYLACQTRCPKIQRHTPDKTRLQSGQGGISVISFLQMRTMELLGLLNEAEPAQLE